MFLAFGLVIEFPILLFGLSRVNIVTSERLKRAAPDGDPRDRDLRGGDHAGHRHRQPDRPGAHDVHPVRGHHLLHRPQRQVAGGWARCRATRTWRTAPRRPRRRPTPATPTGEDRTQEVVVVTGLSGGGKTAAAKLFEDLGYVVVDNLPGELLPDLADLLASDPRRFARTAIVLDVRAGDVPLAFGAMRGALEGRGIRPVIIFLEARDDVLIRRFWRRGTATRWRTSGGSPPRSSRSAACSTPCAPTPTWCSTRASSSLRELRERIFARLGDVQSSDRLAVQLISFGFKYGVPLEADLVLDVRFMRNPFYIEALRTSSGLTEDVRGFVLSQPIAIPFLAQLHDLLDLLVPAYVEEGKTRLTIAIGCTGGFHRSIVISEELATWLRERDFGPVSVFHRELER